MVYMGNWLLARSMHTHRLGYNLEGDYFKEFLDLPVKVKHLDNNFSDLYSGKLARHNEGKFMSMNSDNTELFEVDQIDDISCHNDDNNNLFKSDISKIDVCDKSIELTEIRVDILQTSSNDHLNIVEGLKEGSVQQNELQIKLLLESSSQQKEMKDDISSMTDKVNHQKQDSTFNHEVFNSDLLDDITPEIALESLKKCFYCILKLSEKFSCDESLGSSFYMKSSPSLSFEEYLDRIHAKCTFSSITYITAMYLLQRLTINNDAKEWEIKFPIKLSQVHRLVAALIRISTKLLEDCVHSHDYFSKVCGVSKKLLIKLEVHLIASLDYKGMVITNNRLRSATNIYEQLKLELY